MRIARCKEMRDEQCTAVFESLPRMGLELDAISYVLLLMACTLQLFDSCHRESLRHDLEFDADALLPISGESCNEFVRRLLWLPLVPMLILALTRGAEFDAEIDDDMPKGRR